MTPDAREETASARAGRLFVDLTEDLLTTGRSVRFRARGFSMLPTIRDGESIVVQPSSPHEISLGDIVLCRIEPGFLAHRVVRIDCEGRGTVFVTRGDSSDSCDAPVDAGGILGRVVAVVRNDREVPLTGLLSMIRQRSLRVVFRLRRRFHALRS